MVEITGIDEPLEIRIAFPAFHSRTKRLKDEGGKRVVSYVPEVLKDIYNRELEEIAQKK